MQSRRRQHHECSVAVGNCAALLRQCRPRAGNAAAFAQSQFIAGSLTCTLTDTLLSLQPRHLECAWMLEHIPRGVRRLIASVNGTWPVPAPILAPLTRACARAPSRPADDGRDHRKQAAGAGVAPPARARRRNHLCARRQVRHPCSSLSGIIFNSSRSVLGRCLLVFGDPSSARQVSRRESSCRATSYRRPSSSCLRPSSCRWPTGWCAPRS